MPHTPNLNDTLAALQGTDDAQRATAINDARRLGPVAIQPVAILLASPDTETRRAAKRALQGVVAAAATDGQLGATAAATEAEFLAALAAASEDQPRRQIIWFLSEVGKDPTVTALLPLLQDEPVRDDARCALQRIPGKASLKALQAGFKAAPESFRYAMAESLRKRGQKVNGYPSQSRIPTRSTNVEAAE